MIHSLMWRCYLKYSWDLEYSHRVSAVFYKQDNVKGPSLDKKFFLDGVASGAETSGQARRY